MDKDKIDVRSILAKAEEFRSICLSNDRERCALKEALNTAHSRIAELERDLAKSRQETRKAEADRDDLRITLEKLQSVFTGGPNSPQDKNTSDVPSSSNPPQSRSTADEVHSILATTSQSESNDDGAAVIHHEDVIPEEKEQRIESNSEFICNNEIANDISNYFSSFVVDPQTSSEENLLMSAIPPSIKMVLNSYQSFDKKYLVFVIIETATDSKACHFLSIDDLLALPENEDLLAQLQASQLMSSMPDVGKNYVFFTVVGHLITRSMSKVPKTNPADDADASTSDKTNHHTEPADGDTVTVKEKVAVKRRGAPRAPRKKPPAKKRKPSCVPEEDTDIDYKKRKPSCVSEEDTDIDYVASVPSSTESEEFKSDFEIKSSTADKKCKTRCRVCDIVDHEVNYFHSYQALNCHIIEAHPFNAYPYYYRCPYGDNENECIRHYVKKISLRKHIEACHPEVTKNILLSNTNPKLKSWQCTYCGCTFASHRIYLKHMTDTHPGFAETVKASAQTAESEPQVKSEKIPSSPKLIIKRKKGKFSVSRKSSLSSIDENYVPEEVASPPTRRRKLFLEEDSSQDTVVVSAEIHSVSHVESFTSEIEKSSKQNNDLVDVEDKSNQASAASSDPADLNEFVLNSVYEISSLINQNVTDDRHPATSSILPEPCYEKPQSSVLPSLPCLLDDCSGCEFHPKTLTLDDEYVSSCREEILKDLYSIPENPPVVSSSFTTPLSQSEYDSEETGKSKRDGSLVNSQSSNLVDGFDIVNIIITDDHADSDVPSSNSEIDPKSDENDSDQPPLPKDSSQLLNPVIDDGVIQSTAVIEAENEENRSDIICNTSHAPGDKGEKEVPPSENENCTIVEEIECTEHNNHEKLVPNEEQSILKDDRISSDDIQVTSSDDEIISANEKPLLDNDETILAESVTGKSIPAVPSTDPSPILNHENIDETVREDTNATAMISSDTENLITTPISSVNETLLQIPEKCQNSSLDEIPELRVRPGTPTISENHDKTIIPEISASEDAVDSEDVPPTDPILCPMNLENTPAPANLVSIPTEETFRENTVVSSDTGNPITLPISSENETSLEIPETRQHSSFDEMPELCVSPEAISPYPDGSAADDTTSNLNSTFYDEFGVCEIQTINEKEPSQESTPSSVLSELDLSSRKSNHGTENYPLLRNMLTPRSSTIRCTNQIIDGVGIEIEIGPHSSSPSSSQTSDFVSIQSPHQKEPPSSVETGVDATSKFASYPVLNLNADFSSMLNRMLTDQSLGKLSNETFEKTRMQIDASPSSPTSACSKSSENLKQVQEKDNFEADDVSEIGSVPASSPLPSSPDQMSFNDTNATEHQIAETAVENSPLTTSSNQCGLDNEEDPDAKYYSALTSRDKLIKVTILLPRLRIEKNRPISSRYHLRGQKSIGQLISSHRGRGAKLRSAFYCKICGQICFASLVLSRHINEKHRGALGTIMCSVCGFVSQSKSTLAKHRISRHSLVSPDFTECSICQSTNQPKVIYDCQEALNNHIISTHPNPYPNYIRCPYYEGECEWHLATFDEYRDHIETYHHREDMRNPLVNMIPEMPWQCVICGKVFSCDAHLSNHIRREHGSFKETET